MHKNICQSCGTKMTQGKLDRRGSEADGSRSDKYCNYCYLNGKFQDETMTIEKMTEIVSDSIDNMKSPKFIKKFYKWLYPKQLKQLERWR